MVVKDEESLWLTQLQFTGPQIFGLGINGEIPLNSTSILIIFFDSIGPFRCSHAVIARRSVLCTYNNNYETFTES